MVLYLGHARDTYGLQGNVVYCPVPLSESRWLKSIGPKEHVAIFQPKIASFSLNIWSQDLHKQWHNLYNIPPTSLSLSPNSEAIHFKLGSLRFHLSSFSKNLMILCWLQVVPKKKLKEMLDLVENNLIWDILKPYFQNGTILFLLYRKSQANGRC